MQTREEAEAATRNADASAPPGETAAQRNERLSMRGRPIPLHAAHPAAVAIGNGARRLKNTNRSQK